MPKKVTKKEEEKAIRIGDDMQDLVDSMNTKYGQGTIVGGHTVGEDIETVSTGSLTLDVATGVGGNPVGRLIEIFGLESCGKSTLCLHFIKEFQKAGKKCAIQDNEHSFDRKYATAIGVNVDDLIFAQSGYMEQAYNVIYDLVDSGQFGLIVIDSHTAMRPKRTVEGEIGDALMGVMSKINSEALRKIHPILRPKGCSIIAVAQLRADIGCFEWGSKVLLSNGKTEPIGKIVNSEKEYEVMCYDIENDKFVPKKVTNRFNNGKTESFLKITTHKPYGNGRSVLKCTPNHKILLEDGYKEANELKVGDSVVQIVPCKLLSDIQKEVVIGSLLGDGGISFSHNRGNGILRITHCKEQNKYLLWKSSFFKDKLLYKHSHGGKSFQSFPSIELRSIYKEWYGEGTKKNRIPNNIKLTPLIAAIWYMDDGNLNDADKLSIELSTHCFNHKSQEFLVKLLRKIGVEAKIRKRKDKLEKEVEMITIGRKDTEKFFEYCHIFIHPSMKYKVPEKFHSNIGSCINLLSTEKEREDNISWSSPVLKIEKNTEWHSHTKYDIETEDLHNFIVDGVVVHNSYGDPLKPTGGYAYKFYSDMRYKVTKKVNIEKGLNSTVVEVVKNKCSSPFRKGEFSILWGKGIDRDGEIISLAAELGIFKLAGGGWYTIPDGTKIQGDEKMKEFLNDNPEFKNEVEQKVIEIVKAQ